MGEMDKLSSLHPGFLLVLDSGVLEMLDLKNLEKYV